MPHAAEITFYDELGVAPDATAEQIRDSFRSLVRILHPDHQTDDQLKEISERQMRKLNRIYAVLSDPEKRRRYNESLEGDNRGPTIILSPNSTVNVHRLMERMAWIAAFVVVVIIVVWLSSENQAATQPFQTTERSMKKPPVPASGAGISPEELARLRADLRQLRMERDSAISEISRLRASTPRSGRAWTPPEPPPAAATIPLPTTLTELPSPALPAPSVPVAAAARPAPTATTRTPGAPPKPFTGFWFYIRPASQRGKSTLYPPEFIEATISEQNGVFRGKYRSRYKIVDRAISPDVSFEFAGTANGTTLACPWTGPGGAKGELTLKVVGENAMTVDWMATQLGSMQGLVTGTATLTRRID